MHRAFLNVAAALGAPALGSAPCTSKRSERKRHSHQGRIKSQ